MGLLPDRGLVRRIASTALPFLAALLVVGGIWASGGLFSPAGADSGGSPSPWTVGETVGLVEMQVAGDASWIVVEPGAMLPGPATVRTGPGGHAALTRDADRIVLSASTEVQLPGPDQGSTTRIVQPEGEAFFEVGPRPGWTFSVDTPYLAVVVKGTKFGVGVSEAGTSVSVSEGRVQVDRADGGRADVSAGQTAQTGSAPGSDISVNRSADSSAAAPEAAPSPADVASGVAEGETSAAPGTGDLATSAGDASDSASSGSGAASSGGNSAGTSGGSGGGSGGGNSGGNGSGSSSGNGGGSGSGNSGGNGNGSSGSGGDSGSGNSGGNGSGSSGDGGGDSNNSGGDSGNGNSSGSSGNSGGSTANGSGDGGDDSSSGNGGGSSGKDKSKGNGKDKDKGKGKGDG